MQPTPDIDTDVGFRTRLHEMSALSSARPPDTGRGGPEALPFPDGSFDAALAVLSDHHWRDPIRGNCETMQRVAERVAVFQWTTPS